MLIERLSAAAGSLADQAPQVMEIALPARPESVAEARHALAAYTRARSVPADMAQDGILAISEIVSNAVLHSQTPFLVWAEYDAGHLTPAVLDGSPAFPALLPPDNDREGRDSHHRPARRRLGNHQDPSLGKVVWVDLAPPPPVPEQRAPNG